MTTREAFFECSLVAGQERWTAQVRAWSPAEAKELFRAMLASEGVTEPGTIEVEDPQRVHTPRLH